MLTSFFIVSWIVFAIVLHEVYKFRSLNKLGFLMFVISLYGVVYSIVEMVQ